MRPAFLVAYVALIVVAFLLALSAIVFSRSEPSLAYRAGVALQASYNVRQFGVGVPLRIVGQPVCRETKRFSPTAGSMSCTANVVGPRVAGVGGCIQVIGVYYDKLAAFAESLSSVVPCPE